MHRLQPAHSSKLILTHAMHKHRVNQCSSKRHRAQVAFPEESPAGRKLQGINSPVLTCPQPLVLHQLSDRPKGTAKNLFLWLAITDWPIKGKRKPRRRHSGTVTTRRQVCSPYCIHAAVCRGERLSGQSCKVSISGIQQIPHGLPS